MLTTVASVAPPSQMQTTVPTSTSLQLATVPTSTATLHLTGINTCLLKTAIGNISANGQYVETNILFDKGSQWSILTKGLTDSLNLHPHTTQSVALFIFVSSVPTP